MALCRQLLRAPRLLTQCQRLAVVNSQQMNDYGTMAFTFATPASVYYKAAEVKQIDVPTLSGRFGILVDHVPTVGVLTPGVVRVIDSDSTTKDFFVSTGTVTVNDDSSVQILAEEAYPLDSFDSNAIRTNLQDAQKILASTSNEKEKAEAQIAVDCLETLSRAVS